VLFGSLFQLAAPVLYLDPGSGSFLIQLLVGAGLGLAVAVKMYFARIKNLARRKKSERAAPDEGDEGER